MPRYKVEKCTYYDAYLKREEWYEVSLLIKRKQFWLFGPLVERWKVVQETLWSSGGTYKNNKHFHNMEQVNEFIKNIEIEYNGKVKRELCFEGLGG